MKKTTLLLTVILSLLLIVGMIACSNKEQTNDQTPTQGTTEPSGEQQPPHTHSYGEGTVTGKRTFGGRELLDVKFDSGRTGTFASDKVAFEKI